MLGKCGVDKDDFRQKSLGLTKLLGARDACFEKQRNKKSRTVAACTTALKKVYPEHDTWTDGLLDNLPY